MEYIHFIYTILSLKYYSEFRGGSGYSSFPHQQKWQPQYNWTIVESGVKHHNPNPEFRNWSHFLERRIWDKKQIIGWTWKFTPRWRILYIFFIIIIKNSWPRLLDYMSRDPIWLQFRFFKLKRINISRRHLEIYIIYLATLNFVMLL
jgi:hypothetical protein